MLWKIWPLFNKREKIKFFFHMFLNLVILSFLISISSHFTEKNRMILISFWTLSLILQIVFPAYYLNIKKEKKNSH